MGGHTYVVMVALRGYDLDIREIASLGLHLEAWAVMVLTLVFISVIAVFMGKRSTGGYEIEIVRITRTEEEIFVAVKEKEPPPGSLRTMARTQPYHIVVIRRSPLPVRFQPL